jgi:hypothetical protein
MAGLGAWPLYRLGTALTGAPRVGLVAAALYAGYPLLVRHSADPSDAALTTVLLMAFASESVRAGDVPAHARAGLWLGLAVLTRTMVLPLVPLATLVAWRRAGLRDAAAMAVVAALVVSPYLSRNARLNGSLLPTRSGVNLFISNNEYSARIIPDYGPDILGPYAGSVYRRIVMTRQIGEPRSKDETPLPSAALERLEDEVFTRATIEELRRRPFELAALKARNVAYFFSPRLVPYYVQTPATRVHLKAGGDFVVENSPRRPLLHRVVYSITYTPVLALAALGIWLRRFELSRDGVLWCIVLVFVVVHAVYFPTTRYRVPIEFVLLFYAAVAIDRRLLSAS